MISQKLTVTQGRSTRFISEDYSRAPKLVVQNSDGLICRVTEWGMAASDSGYTVKLYKRWPMLPFLERELYSVVVNETNLTSLPRSASCSSVLSAAATTD
ncbi:MAG TPA: hypothetical protein VN667_13965 [Burkholderiales bacterium]|nr:hypothetical protein [Burkholderiales bacterium]